MHIEDGRYKMTTLGERIKAYREMAKISQKTWQNYAIWLIQEGKTQSGDSLGLLIMRKIIELQIRGYINYCSCIKHIPRDSSF